MMVYLILRLAISLVVLLQWMLGLMGGKHGTASDEKTSKPRETPLILQGYFDFGPSDMGQQALVS